MNSTLRILHLDDDAADAGLVQQALKRSSLNCKVIPAATRQDFLAGLESGPLDLILSDNSVPGLDGSAALAMARFKHPQLPFIFLSGAMSPEERSKNMSDGATACFSKADLKSLPGFIQQCLQQLEQRKGSAHSDRYTKAMESLVVVIQELSLARDLERIIEIVRMSARKLTGADGASFVLRDADKCHYADEDAIAPLWKGHRFPMDICVSGWVMLNRQPVAIEDIYQDPRIPVDAYRPTFVKSLVMVPIRTQDPVGAIGTYWASQRTPHPEEIRILQALADSTSVAMENVQLYSGLEQKVRERAAQLEALNRELDTFSYSVSHDLRAPLRHIVGYLELLQGDPLNTLSAESAGYVDVVSKAASRMDKLIDDLLHLSRTGRVEMLPAAVKMNDLVAEVVRELDLGESSRNLIWHIGELPEVECDRALVKQVWANLLSNAVKYSSKRDRPEVFISAKAENCDWHFSVRDNGVGFDPRYADKLFGVFQRLHQADEFEGSGIGLANAKRMVLRHGGRIWAEARVNEGATFHFTLPNPKLRTKAQIPV